MSEPMIVGKDVQVDIRYRGIPVHGCAITDFNDKPVHSDISQKCVGSNGSKKKNVFEGWEGSLTIIHEDPRVEALVDMYNADLAANIDPDVTILKTVTFAGGVSVLYTYINVNLTFDTTTTRDEAVTTSMNWMTGENRLSSQNAETLLGL